jgi:phenylpropionate dioxygenase-like ring-hydroxylating dioxygenase large terminal subunit
MLINNWYVAARTAEIGATPFKSRMLGLDFVLFRDSTGKITAVGRCIAVK